MSLADHLRELRARLLKSALAITLGAIIGWIFYDQIFDILSEPVNEVIAKAQAEGREIQLTITEITGAFTLRIKVAVLAGVVLASPVWIYQLWRFVTPGLKRKEKKWTVVFLALAVPLFLGGVVMAYLIMPAALGVLFNFTPETVANYQPVDAYLSFFVRLVVVFGVGFLTPLLIVALNMLGILSGKTLLSAWRWIIFGILVFGAVATPTGDPINLALLVAPILLLVGLALAFCFINDRRRARKRPRIDYAQWGDDELSPL